MNPSWLIVVAVVVLGVGACGDSDDSPGTPSPDSGPDGGSDGPLPDAGEDGEVDGSLDAPPDTIDGGDAGGESDAKPPVVCPPGLTNCSDVCVDVGTSAANCGGCGHDCQGGTCSEGVCQPVSLGTTAALDHPGDIQIDSTNIYFTFGWGTNQSGLGKLPLAGGTPTPIVTGKSWINRLVSNSTSLFWSEYGSQPGANGSVSTIAKTGGASTSLAGNLAYPTSLAVDATHVYYAAQGWLIARAPISGGTPETLFTTSGAYDAFDITIDAANIYFSLTGKAGSIQKVPLTGGTASVLATNANYPYSIAANSTHVYWADIGTAPTYADGTINRVPIVGGKVEVLAVAQCQPEAVRVDASYVYWVTACGGTVARAPLAGGPTRILASGQKGPSFLALGEETVYFTTSFGYDIMKVAK